MPLKARPMLPLRAVLGDESVSHTAKLIYILLGEYANEKQGNRAWPSIETIAQGIGGMSVRSVRYAMRELTNKGWVEPAGKGRHGRTVWRVLSVTGVQRIAQQGVQQVAHLDKNPLVELPKEHLPASPKTLAPPSEPKVQDGRMTRRQPKPPPEQDALLPVDDDRPKPTAAHLVAAWVDGYRERRQVDPHPNTVRRVAGQAGSLAKDCSQVEDWRRAWQACLAAGRAGRIDPGPFLIDEQPRSLYPVKVSMRSVESALAAEQTRAITGFEGRLIAGELG